jgi:hypothetical protein
MKLKLDEAGHVVVSDGRPVYVHEDGKEVPFDAAHTLATITRLNGEAKGHRESKEAAEARLKAFEGLDDADAARKALETVKNLGAGELKTAAQVEEIKAEARKAAEEQVRAAAEANGRRLKELEAERNKFRDDLYGEKVGGSFSRSKYIAENVAAPIDMVQAMFGQRFKVEDGRTVGYDAAGNKIYSRAKPGELADFDEALEMIVDSYAYRDQILRGTGSTGGGARGGNSDGGGSKTMKRAEFDRLDPTQRAETVRGGTAIVD